ncbi:MAG: hypothetical protein C0602_08260, partial [Denitrovibrio sp.]
TAEDTSLTINALTNDTDVDGDTLTVESFAQPTNGTAVLNENGTFTYTPNADYNGSDSFTYTITDGKGGTSTATVNIGITSVNDAPETSDKTVSVDADGKVTFALDDFSEGGAKDTEDDSSADMTTNIVINSLPEHGKLFDAAGDEVQVGDKLSDISDLTYVADEGYNATVFMGSTGEPGAISQWGDVQDDGSIRFEPANGLGATITATYKGNPAEIGFNEDIGNHLGLGIGVTASGDEGQIEPNEKITIDFDQKVTNGVVGLSGLGGHFVDGASQDAQANWNAYAENENGDMVLVASGFVTKTNDSYVTAEISVTDEEGNPVAFDQLTFDVSTNSNSNYTVQYIQYNNADMSDSFNYTAEDSDGLTGNESTVTFALAAGATLAYNTAPESEDKSVSVEDGQAVFSLDSVATDLEDDANRSDANETSIRIESLPEHGHLEDLDGNVLSTGDIVSDASDIKYVFDGNADDNVSVLMGSKGSGSINDWGTYSEDEGNIRFESGEVTATIFASNEGVGFSDYSGINNHEGFGLGVVSNSGDDGQIERHENLTIEFDNPVSNATVGLAGLGGHFESGVNAFAHWTTYDEDGNFVAEGFVQNDNGNETNSFNTGDLEFYSLVLTVESTTNSNYTLQYIEFGATTTDAFTYATIDSDGKESDIATVTFDIEPSAVLTAEHAPEAAEDIVETTEDTAVTFNLLSNDTDLDGDTLTVESFVQPENGTVSQNGDGTFTYTPNADYNGSDSFTYTITDGKGGTDTATVKIGVTPVNDAPFIDLNGDDPLVFGDAEPTGFETDYVIGEAGTAIADSDMYITDADSDTMSNASVVINDAKDGDALNSDGIDTSLLDVVNNGTTVTITPKDGATTTNADFESAVKAVTFSTTDETDTDRDISVNVNDGKSDSNIAVTSVNITVPESYERVADISSYDDFEAEAFKGHTYANNNSLKTTGADNADLTIDNDGFYAVDAVERNNNGDDPNAIETDEAVVFDMKGLVDSVTFEVKGEVGGSTWDIYDAEGDRIDYADGSNTNDGRPFVTLNDDGTATFTSDTPFRYIAFDGGDNGQGNQSGTQTGFALKPVSAEFSDSDNNVLSVLDEGGDIDFAGMEGLEAVHMNSSQAQSIENLSIESVLQVTDDDNILQIAGGKDDTLDMNGWEHRGEGVFTGSNDSGDTATVQITGDFSFDAGTNIVTFNQYTDDGTEIS